MAIITRKTGEKRFSFAISTGERDANGKYKYIRGPYFATKAEARKAELKVKNELMEGTYITPTKMTLQEMLEAYMDTKVEHRTNSKNANRSFIKQIATQPCYKKPITDITPLDMEQYRVYLYSKYSPQTIRESLSFVRSAFSWAVDTDLLAKSPARRIKLPPKQEPKGMHIPIDILVSILKIIKKNDYYALYIPFLLGGMCGMRISETLAIPANVLSGDYILVRHNLLREDGVLQLEPLKTRTSMRDIPISSFVRRELAEYAAVMQMQRQAAEQHHKEVMESARYPELVSAAWKNKLDLLITFPDDGRPMSKDFIERRWRKFKSTCPDFLKLVQEYPLLANMRHHDFRHSFGSNMRDKGISLADISDILGHADVSFTAKTYALPLEGAHLRAVNAYEAAIANVLY